jgi:hypothetical protein
VPAPRGPAAPVQPVPSREAAAATDPQSRGEPHAAGPADELPPAAAAEPRPAESAVASEPAETKSAEAKPAETKLAEAVEPKPPEPAKSAEPAAPAEATPAEASAAPKPNDSKPGESSIVVNEDGSTTVEGKFTFRGKGTQAEPYIITWDQLLSVQDEYAPKEGRNQLPARVTVLDGKWVQIAGNIAFPLMMDDADECLVMLNQWDGCCIGVPPTPYDAVEVQLGTLVRGNDRLTTFGTITGKMKVDPHLVGGWLVGLYLMEDAKLKPEAYGGFAP